jgi:hypothetical protein
MKNVYTFFVCLVLIYGCKQDDVSVFPEIEIIAPYDGQLISVGDSFNVRANIKCKDPLMGIQLKIFDQNMAHPRLVFNQSIEGQTQFSLERKGLIDDPGLESGEYWLQFAAFTEENYTLEFAKVSLNEVPYALDKIILLLTDDFDRTSIREMSPGDSVFVSFIELYHKVLLSGINSKAQLLYYIYNSFGDQLHVHDFSVPNTSWLVYAGTSDPYFTDIAVEDYYVYVGREDGSISAYDQGGIFKFGTPPHSEVYPEKIGLTDDYIIGASKKRVGNELTLTVYYKITGAYKHKLPIDFACVSMAQIEANKLILFANKNGKGEIYSYLPEENIVKLLNTVDEEFRHMEQISSNEFLLSTPNQIFKYNLVNNNLDLFVDIAGVAGMRYENLSDELYIYGKNNLWVYSKTSLELKKEFTFVDEITGLECLYNR